jgi:uncharacterized protein YceK
MSNSVTEIGLWAFSGCSSLTSITLSNSLEHILNRAFENCSSLTAIEIPESVTEIEIGQWAFSGCSSLASVTIPNSVSFMDYYYFKDCINLSSVTVNWPTPLPVSDITFYNVNTSAVTLNVPAGTEALYKAAPIWKDFNIVVSFR